MDRRTLPGETEKGVCKEIIRFLRAKGCEGELINTKTAPCLPLETDPNLPLVRRFAGILRQSKPAGVHFFCDASVLSAGGIPSVVFGPGNIAQAHTAAEWISLESLNRATRILERFLRSLP
jgi:acetylornithine deacetylase